MQVRQIMGDIRTSGGTRMTRRSVLRGALATAAVAAARPVLARQMQTHLPPGVAAKPKGPLVFLAYDQDEIDFAYDQAPWAPTKEKSSSAAGMRLASVGLPRDVEGEGL
jgi:hypothetical protein